MAQSRPASLLLLFVSLAACGLFPSAQQRAMQKNPNFRQGYEDGCAAASTRGANPREGPFRDEALYRSDAAYRNGWSDGYSLCRSDLNAPASPAAGPAFGSAPGGG